MFKKYIVIFWVFVKIEILFLEIDNFNTVKVIILLPEADDIDVDDTPIQEIKESLTRAFEEVKSGKTRPISELWERIENE